jgi:hypothetical protein
MNILLKTRDKFVVYLDEKARKACDTLEEAKIWLAKEINYGIPHERLFIKYNRMPVSMERK